MSEFEELLTIEQAARFLQVSETSLRRWTNAGQLACLRVGGRRERRFRRADLLAYMEAQSVKQERVSEPRSPVVVDGVSIPLGAHLSGIYSSEATRTKMAADFLRDGVRPHSMGFLFGEQHVGDQVLASIGATSPVRHRVDIERLTVSRFQTSAAAQLDFMEAHLAAAVQAGTESMRVVGDMWGFRKLVSSDELVQFESDLDHRIAARFPVALLCLYDAQTFSRLDLLQALQGHTDIFRC